jgi:hypothetical protein
MEKKTQALTSKLKQPEEKVIEKKEWIAPRLDILEIKITETYRGIGADGGPLGSTS